MMGTTEMNRIETVENGFTAQAGRGGQGWFAGALLRPNRDEVFIEHLGEPAQEEGARLKDGRTYEEWEAALAAPQALRVVLVTADGNGAKQTVLAEAERVWGPAAASRASASALLAWTERRDGSWRLVVWQDGKQFVLFESPYVLRDAAVAELDGEAYAACLVMEPDGLRIRLFDGLGRELYATEGRQPRLEAGADHLFLCWEAPGTDTCRLRVVEFAANGRSREVTILAGDDMDLNASLAFDADAEALYLAHEACPAWGHDHFVGRHRDLYL